ncbi:hypothetical protein FRUB_01501 [Fimbriiglobus ruber]|uniref:Uncharacterized protein n=1 Tax=Fimbriiglobus ruber TaxID=1908690 RepID=A0A225DUH8_9BACT|nr:hypothetical protein FRUB_01501 [Fimbriiglobus ruber]
MDDNLPGGYSPKPHQRKLTQAVSDWQPVREQMRSFRRLESALQQLATAIATGVHVATPTLHQEKEAARS